MRQTHFRSCNLCEASCGVAITVEDDRVVEIRGDEEDAFSRGYICPKAAALADLHHDPDRLRRPMRRDGDRWSEIGWDQAFDDIAARLREVWDRHGKDALAVYQGNPTVHSLGLLTFGQLLLRKLGTRNMYSSTSVDQLPHMLASYQMLGHQALLPVPDLDRTDYMLILGGNPLVSNGSLMTAPGVRDRLKKLRARGGKLVVIDPRRSETAEIADEHFFVRPGSDALLLLAILHVLFAEGLTDFGRLAGRIDGEAEVRRVAAGFAPERVAAAVGIDAPSMRRLARELAAAPTAIVYGRMGVSVQAFGGLCAWLIDVVNLATGNFDEVGGVMFTTPAVDIVRAADSLGFDNSYARFHSRVRGLPEFGGELPASCLAEEIETPGTGQVRALITSAANPVLATPNGGRLERALPSLELMVSIDPYMNETTRHAHYILPPTSFLERSHYDLALYAVSVRNVAKYSPPVFARGDEQRHDWEIAAELASRLVVRGGRVAQTLARAALLRLGPEAVLDLGLRTGSWGLRRGRAGLSLRKLRAQPHGVDLGPLEPRLPALLRTEGKRIALAPPVYLADVARLEREALTARAGGGLSLIGRRHLRSSNSWMHNSERLVKGKPRCTLLIHPDDAAARGLRDGEVATVRSRVGAVSLPVEVSDEIMRGVVSIPHGWGHDRPGTRTRVAEAHPGVSINDVTDDTLVDLLAGTASLSGVPVTVQRAELQPRPEPQAHAEA
jgi:anaerobic selenocysteine-containing dehydrogenase